ncbi:tripartite tricarboxylate transporter substrate binding protein [Achromobacter sp. Bel]|uniref:tripartite tricarboxylate transporter substrate-binding protein n=1 Tax=Achromobacter sp. Bel TaxID=2727415 RepID=UPI00145CDCD6|nr:tripartite tricarboxylate transporter substrate binding protein [Achromobacter sp. Bel]
MKAFDRSVTRRGMLGVLGAGMLMAPFALRVARAQDSARPVRLILPISVGSGVDTIVRSAGPALNRAFGQSVVVENQPGAGGILGTSAIVRATADGHTLGVVSNNHVIFPSVLKSVPFDPILDITPISIIGATPLLLVVNPVKLPYTNVRDLVAALRTKPDAYNYGSSGNGTILHLGCELFLQQNGLKIRHIPYKGTGPMVTDIMSGQVDFGVTSLPSILPHLKSGALKAIGVGSKERSPAAPEIPTIREQGMPDYEVEGWFAVIGPAKLPADQVRRVYRAFDAAYHDPETKKAMDVQGNRITMLDPAKSLDYFKSETRKYAAIVKNANIELQ